MAINKFLAIGTSFNTPANWSLGTVPTNVDVATFDAVSGNCNIDINADVLGIDTTGYTNTLTQDSTRTIIVGASGWQHVAGTFAGGDSAITIKGNSLLSGGTFTSTSALLLIQKADFDLVGATFNHNSGSVRKQQTNSTNTTLLGAFTFYDFEILDSNTGSSHTHITFDADIIVKSTFTSNTREQSGWWTYLDGAFVIHCEGDVNGNKKSPLGTMAINVDGASGDQTITDMAIYSGTFVVNKASGNAVISGELLTGFSASNVLDFQSTVDFTTNSATLKVGLNQTTDLTLTASQNFTVYDLSVNGSGTGTGIFDLALNTIAVKGNLTGTISASGWNRKIDNGTIELEGNIDINVTTTHSNAHGTALIKLVGTNSATIRTALSNSHFNDVLVAKTAPATVQVLDQFSNLSGVFEPSNQFDNDGGNGSVNAGTFLIESGVDVVAQVNKLLGEDFLQNGGTFTGNGVKHEFDGWIINAGVHTIYDVKCIRTPYRVEPASTYTMLTGGTLDSVGDTNIALQLDMNSNSIHNFIMNHGAFDLNFQSPCIIEGNASYDGGGRCTGGYTIKHRGDILTYTRSRVSADSLTFLFDESYDQNINHSDSSKGTNDGFPSLDLRTSGGRKIYLTSGTDDFNISNSLYEDLGADLIEQADMRLRFMSEREMEISTTHHWISVFINKGSWLPHLILDLHADEFEFSPRNGSNPSLTNDGTGSGIFAYKKYKSNSVISASAAITSSTPKLNIVGSEDFTIEGGTLGKIVETEVIVDKDAGIITQLSDIKLNGGAAGNAGKWNVTILNGVWCTNEFDFDCDGTLAIDNDADFQKTPSSNVTPNSTIGIIQDVSTCQKKTSFLNLV